MASPDGQRAIGFGGIGEDRRQKTIIAMESNGTITRRWDFDDASAFVGKAAPSADLFVALYGPSLGPLKLLAISFSGTPKWEKTFDGASLRHVAPESLTVSSNGAYTLASITEAVIVLDRTGQEVRRYKDVRMAQMSPDGRHALMWGPGKLMADALDGSNPSEWDTSDQEETPIRGGVFSEDGERVCIVRAKNKDGSRQVSSVILIDIPAKSSARAMPTSPLKLKSKASCRYSREDIEVSLDSETLHFNAP